MIRIAVVEDDKEYRKVLDEYLKQYEKESGTKIRIQYFEDGEDIVEDYSGDFDIILMDIEMQFMDGMTAAEKIRSMDEEVVIIFITNMPGYATSGYKVEALDYVLKPVSYYAFSQRIARAVSRMKKRARKFVSIPMKGGMRRMDVSRICYVEVFDHDLIYHTLDGNLQTKGALKDVEQTLSDLNFFRCSKGFLVNMEHVEGIQDNDAIVAGDRIRISRTLKKNFLNSLNDYMNEVSK
ncbi:MAG: LytTR family DNA-binding domain-containing protein [Lachnospiraceae bacterium]|nr:LytTR family DNA-binding domain-containing protein [Lachnospiraceae bacterium]